MAAQPFRDPVCGRENKDAACTRSPKRRCRGTGEGRKQRKSARHQHGNEGNLPFMRGGIDSKCEADPVEPGQEMAEAECPASKRGRADRMLACLRAIDEEQERRECQKQERKYSKRCKGEGRQ